MSLIFGNFSYYSCDNKAAQRTWYTLALPLSIVQAGWDQITLSFQNCFTSRIRLTSGNVATIWKKNPAGQKAQQSHKLTDSYVEKRKQMANGSHQPPCWTCKPFNHLLFSNNKKKKNTHTAELCHVTELKENCRLCCQHVKYHYPDALVLKLENWVEKKPDVCHTVHANDSNLLKAGTETSLSNAELSMLYYQSANHH